LHRIGRTRARRFKGQQQSPLILILAGFSEMLMRVTIGPKSGILASICSGCCRLPGYCSRRNRILLMDRMVAVKTADKAQSVLVGEGVGCSCSTLLRYSLNEHMSQSKQPAAKLLSPTACFSSEDCRNESITARYIGGTPTTRAQRNCKRKGIEQTRTLFDKLVLQSIAEKFRIAFHVHLFKKPGAIGTDGPGA